MAIAKAGQSSFDMWGDEAILSEEFLSNDFGTWNNGLVSINHANNNDLLDNAKIIDVEYDPETTLVWATFPDLPEKALELINSDFYEGLSQECIPIRYDGNNVTKGYGVGVTIVTYPNTPAATPEMGVGVRTTGSMLAATLTSKYPEYSIAKGGTSIPETDPLTLESATTRISELESENKTLKENVAKANSSIESTVRASVTAALESRDAAQKEQKDRDEAITELKAFMPAEALESFLGSEPTTSAIKATSAALKASAAKQVGAGDPGELQSTDGTAELSAAQAKLNDRYIGNR